MNEHIKQVNKRLDRVEVVLDEIAHNHLAHIEKFTRWTLTGIVISVSLSVISMALIL